MNYDIMKKEIPGTTAETPNHTQHFLPFSAAVFDYDGTILDSMPMWSSVPSRFVRSLGAEPEPGLDEIVRHMSLEESAEYLREYGASGTDEEIIGQIMDLVFTSYQKELQPKPGVIDVLTDLKNHGIRMCIATQTPGRMIKEANRRLGLDTFFEEVFSCEEWNTHKREPLIYEIAATHFNMSPEKILVFEDICYAVETAARSGFSVIGVYDDNSAADRKRIENSCRYYLESYSDWPGATNLFSEPAH